MARERFLFLPVWLKRVLPSKLPALMLVKIDFYYLVVPDAGLSTEIFFEGAALSYKMTIRNFS